jgi:GAF domain-containing protein/ligand-binding sensor protein
MRGPVGASLPRSDGVLTDVIGVDTLQAIQDAFARAFGLPTVIVDTTGRNVTEITHRVAFCEDLTRPTPGGTRCSACDADAMRRAESTGQPAIFRCWNHLYDCAIPIVSNDGCLFGHFLCGQIFMEPTPLDGYRTVAREIGVGEDEYVAAVEEVRVVPRARFERAVEAMGVLARMIADLASASMQNLAVLEQTLEAKAATGRLTRELDTIVEASGAIAAAGDSRATLERIADSIGHVVPCDSCVIFELEAGGRRLCPLTVRDPYADAIADCRIELGVGIPGLVAMSGASLRIDDVRADPRFVPLPNVPVEPEAILAVPMLFNGEVSGVITVSRFKQRTFSDHELDVLKILAAQSAIALATAAFRDQVAQRLETERAHAELAGRIGAGGPLRPILDDVLATAGRLLACPRAALRLDDRDLSPGVRLIGMSERAADAIVRTHADACERARAARRSVACRHEDAAMLVAPVEAGGRTAGQLVLLRPDPFSESDLRLAASLAALAGAAVDNARGERSRRRLQAGYEVLAQVGAEIAVSASSEAIVEVLLRRAHELVGGDAGFLALTTGPAPDLDIRLRAGGQVREARVSTAGHPRLRMPHALDENGTCRGELLDAWAEAVLDALPVRRSAHTVAAPLTASGGRTIGALIVTGGRSFGAEEHQLLAVLAHAAAAGLAARWAERDTDQVLRERVDGLARLTEIAHRLVACHDLDAVLAGVLSCLRELADVSGVALAARRAATPELRASVGFSRARAARLLTSVPDHAWEAVSPVRTEAALALPLLAGDRSLGLIVVAAPAQEPDEEVLTALSSYAAIALDNAERLEAERRSLAEVRELHHGSVTQAGELERSLAIQRALSEAVLDVRGISSVVETLVRLQGGRVTVYDADLHAIAGFPDPPTEGQPIAQLLTQQSDITPSTALEVDLAEGRALVAAPIQAEGERLGWLVQQLSRAFGEVDRAAVAHAATAAALAIVRARTADEVEARMRGEFLQSLLGGEASAEELVRRGRALTYDLAQPSRVAVIAAARESAETTERLYRETVRWARRAPGRVFVAKRGSELTVLGPGDGGWPPELHDVLLPAVGSVLVGVGGVAGAPDAYRQSFLDARQCVRALRGLGRDGVLALDGEGLEQLLLRATDTDQLIAFVDGLVEPLRRHDARRRSDLIATLDLVFEHGWNLRAAARAAHVHVSTLRYRLARVQEITGVDLRMPEDRLRLELALRASRLLTASGRGRPEPTSPAPDTAEARPRARPALLRQP